MSSPSPVLIFVNPKSGGKVGQEIIDEVSNLENVHIVKLPDQATEWTTRDRSLLFDPNLRVLLAGGDGSVNWGISMLVDFYGPEGEFKPPFGVLPIGTGNDMSRTIGWGGYFGHFDVKKTPKMIEKMRSVQNVKQLDVWLKVHQRTDIPNAPEEKKYMVNYFSLGIDAKIALDFENCRRSCPGCFCCRCMSKTIYGPTAFGSCCCQPVLRDYVKGTYQECIPGNSNTNYTAPEHDLIVQKQFEFSTFAKTVVFHNIFSRYCGKDTWKDYKKRPRDFYDGMIEISTCAGFWALTLMQLNINTYRNIARVKSSELETSEPTWYEIDGEASIINGPAKISISHYCTYPVLVIQEKKHG